MGMTVRGMVKAFNQALKRERLNEVGALNGSKKKTRGGVHG